MSVKATVLGTVLGIALGLNAIAPSHAQPETDQTIVLHCIKNQNESLDVILDLAQNTYSVQLTMANFNGPGSTFTASPDQGTLQSVSSGEVDFNIRGFGYSLNRYTGILSVTGNIGTYKCARGEKVF